MRSASAGITHSELIPPLKLGIFQLGETSTGIWPHLRPAPPRSRPPSAAPTEEALIGFASLHTIHRAHCTMRVRHARAMKSHGYNPKTQRINSRENADWGACSREFESESESESESVCVSLRLNFTDRV
jgi:hypothetical protein